MAFIDLPMKSKLFFAAGSLWLFSMFSPVFSQNYIGLGGSNYAGVSGIYYNPATIIDSRYRFEMNLFTTGIFASNNYLSYSIINDEVKEDLSFHKKNAYFNVDLRGLSAMYDLQLKRSTFMNMKRFAFAVDNRFRVAVSVSRISKSTAQLAFNGLKDTTLHNINFFDPTFDIDIMAWREMGFTAGAQVIDNTDVVVNAAVHIKRLYGVGAGYIHNNQAKFLVTDEDTIYISDMDAEYGHSTANFFGNDKPETIGEYDEAGSGFGFDLGVIYEYRPDIYRFSYQRRLSNNNNKYKFRAGFALLDLGSINFNKGSRKFSFRGDNFITRQEIDALGDPYEFDSLAKAKFQMMSSAESFKMKLPSSVNIQLDYCLHPLWYLNLNFIAGIRHRKTYGIRQADFLTLTPRLETRYLEFALPLAIKDFSQMQMGIMAKLGVLTVGSDNIAGILFKEGNGADFYISARIPVFNK